MIYETLHREPKIEQNEAKKKGGELRCSGRDAVHVPPILTTKFLLYIYNRKKILIKNPK
jgi:hypothetical protein